MRRKESGFTLIEILVVVTVIGVLMGLVALIIPMAFEARDETVTTTRVQEVANAVTQMASPSQLGWYPSAAIERLKGPGGENIGRDVGAGNETNRGIEALVIAIFMQGLEMPLDIPDDALQNTDLDKLLKNPTRLDTDERFEIVDAWDNPLVYFSSAEYKNPDAYKKVMMASGEVVDALPFKTKTGLFVNARSFQLFSAGADGIFNTKDDVGNFVNPIEEDGEEGQ
jgi:prepilin-type N-terminal cleavage/methylation domain-containing protein